MGFLDLPSRKHDGSIWHNIIMIESHQAMNRNIHESALFRREYQVIRDTDLSMITHVKTNAGKNCQYELRDSSMQ